MRWHILTGEYPPQPGGVADYTRLVADALSGAGDRVDVWAPGVPSGEAGGVAVHGLPDHYGPRSLGTLTRQLRADAGQHRLLVQYVPHAFGWKGGNVPFCLWLRGQARESTWVMFHEVAFPIDRRQRLALNGLGVVTRGMAALVAGAAGRIFVSIPAWEPLVRCWSAARTPVEWLPVPSSISVHADASVVQEVRARLAPRGPLIGHFGTFGGLIRPLLLDALPLVFEASPAALLLIGRGAADMAADLLARWPGLGGRVHAADSLEPHGVSCHVAACDLMLQPYPDGISSRRTSAMVALAHGRAVVTTAGTLTEPMWQRTASVVLTPAGDARALARACVRLTQASDDRTRLAARARALYDSVFDMRHTVARLRAVPHVADVRVAS